MPDKRDLLERVVLDAVLQSRWLWVFSGYGWFSGSCHMAKAPTRLSANVELDAPAGEMNHLDQRVEGEFAGFEIDHIGHAWA